ncbi:PD-(D/E)XK motif protein [Actinoplanes hulinensis]|uniref:PD-(D/E)XK motif protein n=1 Tax=Actinoplanes hulinensis TaxID=1144547 RepID=A0ABS7BEF1_9ACTN|nr:PD-(D/E)XK motif protein [Actinoplanes hulinensis]MBW6439256.1 PD-(D/E)XK motif protein [Actinoplanes hulinensis]MBW6439267.1 PD-(D/E)XK motif protein [Actinoplanes hulinensis]
MITPARDRHLSRDGLADYVARVPAAIAVPGEPSCRIDFEPQRHELSLRTPYQGTDAPDVARYENVRTSVVDDAGSLWAEIVVRYDDNEYEAYLLISDIADLIQQDGLPFPAAVDTALSTFGALLTRAGALSAERQIGLYGEMIFLESCIRQLGPATAVESWKGHAANEHDFVFQTFTCEIKTTRTERRRHTISGLDQLDPVPGAPLWLISVQITTATSVSGRSLAQLVDDVRAATGPAAPTLGQALGLAGWRERDRSLYREPWRLRALPAAFPVNNDFPSLNRQMIKSACPRPELIVGATYTVDLTNLTPGTPPAPAHSFITGDHHG